MAGAAVGDAQHAAGAEDRLGFRTAGGDAGLCLPAVCGAATGRHPVRRQADFRHGCAYPRRTGFPHRLWWLVAIEFGIAVLGNILTRTIDYTDSVLADKYTRHVSIRVMKHAAELDVIAYEDPVFYDRLESIPRDPGRQQRHAPDRGRRRRDRSSTRRHAGRSIRRSSGCEEHEHAVCRLGADRPGRSRDRRRAGEVLTVTATLGGPVEQTYFLSVFVCRLCGIINGQNQ